MSEYSDRIAIAKVNASMANSTEDRDGQFLRFKWLNTW